MRHYCSACGAEFERWGQLEIHMNRHARKKYQPRQLQRITQLRYLTKIIRERITPEDMPKLLKFFEHVAIDDKTVWRVTGHTDHDLPPRSEHKKAFLTDCDRGPEDYTL